MKAYYDEKPSVISEVGNGSILYRYGIEEVETSQVQTQATDTDEEQPEAKKQFVCQEVQVWKPVTSNRITEAVITDRWDSNYEQKLINEYNAAQLGLLGAKSSDEAKARIAAYTDYLKERATLKAQVDADCETLGIE